MIDYTLDPISVKGFFQNHSIVGLMSEMPRFVVDLIISSNPIEVEGKSYQLQMFIRGSIKQFNPYSPTKIVLTDEQVDRLNNELFANAFNYFSEDFMFDHEEFDRFLKFEDEPQLVSVNHKTKLDELDKVRSALSNGLIMQVNQEFEAYLAKLPALLKSQEIPNLDKLVPRD